MVEKIAPFRIRHAEAEVEARSGCGPCATNRSIRAGDVGGLGVAGRNKTTEKSWSNLLLDWAHLIRPAGELGQRPGRCKG